MSSPGAHVFFSVINLLCLYSISLMFPFSILRTDLGTVQRFSFCIYSFDEISATKLSLEMFSRLSDVNFSHFFFFISVWLMLSDSNILKHLWFSFSVRFRMIFWFGSSIPSVDFLSYLFLLYKAHFSIVISIHIWLYALIVNIRVHWLSYRLRVFKICVSR